MALEGPERESGPESSSQTPSTLRLWSAFEFRDYRFLWLSGISSLFTMEMRLLATTVWLYQETGSGAQLGALGIIQLIVQFPAILYGGALADRLDRKRLIAFTQVSSLVLLTALALLSASDALRPWHIYGVTAVLSVTSILGSPARAALTSNVVPRTHLMHAVTSNVATFEIGAVVAPLAFTGIITAFGTTATFTVAAVTAVPSVLLPLMIRSQNISSDNGEGGSVLRRVWQGFQFVKAHPILPGLLIMDLGVNMVSFFRQVLPLIVDRLLRAGPGAVGALTAANSFGGVIGSLAVLFLARYRSKGMLVLWATFAYALLLVIFGLSASMLVAVPVIIALGVTDAIGMASRQTIVQLTTPDEVRGRAVSFHEVSAESANNLGTIYVGFMSQQIGPRSTLALGGLISMIVVVATWAFISGVRRFKYP
ncbi:MAG: MFS transporter [SAR202 cluster bacterium]|nr:MFS transporter [SAR202 cluster bacterium]MDP6514846.1 MFS transporter [SAR202 cluster bacterium]MDP6714744.1 MFS transporter [SAR202 cluster bacterium]